MDNYRQSHRSTGDPWLDLVAAVARRALRDAQQDVEAARWVDDFAEGIKRPEFAIVANGASGNSGISARL